MTPRTATADLTEYLESRRPRVEAALDRAVGALESELGGTTAAAVRHGVMSGGKRLRPILCIGAFEACDGRASPPAFDLAASLELIHAYSLMHDDLPCMDNAELRRGRPTTHREHGEEATMRAGAVLIPAAALQALSACRALGCGPAEGREIARVLMRAAGAGGMVGGQWLDLLGEGRALDAAALDGLHRRKTGALLAAALVMGGLAARAPAKAVSALEQYGRAVGLSFQIADDILDATQSADTLGKRPSDVALDKSTYVELHGLARARELAREESDRAVDTLERAGIQAPALVALARYVVQRER